MKLNISGGLYAAVSFLVACGSSNPPVDAPPSGVHSILENCSDACVRLNQLGCPEGENSEACVNICLRIQNSGYLWVPTDRIAAAKTVSDVRASGVDCQ